jgi:hypothetical protein
MKRLVLDGTRRVPVYEYVNQLDTNTSEIRKNTSNVLDANSEVGRQIQRIFEEICMSPH